jgi:exodeoxyribonuclease X
MSGAIILDTETTGLDDPEVIALAHTSVLESPTNLSGGIGLQFFKPSKPISLGALATHHIIDEDLVDAPPWPRRWAPDSPETTQYLIGHNIDFDWKAIGQPHIARICTLALARRLLPDLDSHNLTALTYYFYGRIAGRELVKKSHDAAHDVYLCLLLLEQLLKLMPGMTSWHQAWQASERARVPTRFTFGKYGPKDGKKGQFIADVRKKDPGYIKWCLGVPEFATDPYLSKALRGEAA